MPKQLIGIVSSSKGDKTIVVTVHERKTHPLYRKQYTVTKKFMAHDAKNEAQPGDKVAIVETRPVSARKRHALDRIIEKPKLRADSLTVTKTEEPELPASKGKAKDEETAPAKQEAEKETEE
jgi:small subunit ribosomal protein S17